MNIKRSDLDRMAEKLLAGYKMLGIHCPDCKAPLFQHPKTKEVTCPVCGAKFEVVKGKLTMVEEGEKREVEKREGEAESAEAGAEEEEEPEEVEEEEEETAEEEGEEGGEEAEEAEESEEGEEEAEEEEEASAESEEAAEEAGQPEVTAEPGEVSESDLRDAVMNVVKVWLDRAARTEDPDEAVRDLKVAKEALKLLQRL